MTSDGYDTTDGPIDRMVGHDRAAFLLSSMAHPESGFIDSPPRSLLFHGPSGVGKMEAARLFFCQINCPSADSPDHDLDDCEDCRLVSKGRHPDLTVISPSDKGWIKVDDIRSALDDMRRAEVRGDHRMMIVRQSSCLTASSADAMLKETEEGAGSPVFIFLCEHPSELIETIQSRSISVPFGRLSDDQVRAAADEDDHGEVLSFAKGSPGRIPFLAEKGEDISKVSLALYAKMVSGSFPLHKMYEVVDKRIPFEDRESFFFLESLMMIQVDHLLSKKGLSPRYYDPKRLGLISGVISTERVLEGVDICAEYLDLEGWSSINIEHHVKSCLNRLYFHYE